MRIDRTPYFADIVEDDHTEPPIWHCIVQRHGSSSVIAWFQEASEQAARQSAETELQNLKLQDLKRSGQLPLQLDPDPNQAA